MTTLIRIDPMKSSNKIITRDNFIRPTTLNKILEINCSLHNWDTNNTNPNNGFWLSQPTNNGTSCAWRDYTLQEVKSLTEHMQDVEQNYDKWVAEGKIITIPDECNDQNKDNDWYGYIENWSNPKKITYILKNDANLLHLTDVAMMLKYKMQAPSTDCYINCRKRYNEELQIVNDFIESNNLDTTITESNNTMRGINVTYDHEKFSSVSKLVSITRAKCGGSKNDMIKSCNALIDKINKDIKYIDKCEKARFCIDWDKIREDGFDGVVFYDYMCVKYDSDDENEMACFLSKWIPNTVVVWTWCFEDDIDVGQYMS